MVLFYIDHIEVPRSDGFLDGSIPSSSPSPGGYLFRPGESMVTHLTYTDSGLYPDYAVGQLTINEKLQIVIPLQLHFKTRYMIEHNSEAFATSGTFVKLHIDIYGEVVKTKKDHLGKDESIWPWIPRIVLKFDKIDFMNLADLISPQEQNEITQKLKALGAINIPISFGVVNNLVGPDIPVNVYNVGVSANSTLSHPSIRWEINGPAESFESWNNFYNAYGYVGVLAQGKDWGLVIPGQLLADSFAQKISHRLGIEDAKTGDDKRIEVLEWPTAYWEPLSGSIITKFDVDIVDHSKTLCVWDIGVEIKIISNLGVAEENKIQIVGNIEHTLYPGDVFKCISTEAQSIPLAPIVVGIVLAVLCQYY